MADGDGKDGWAGLGKPVGRSESRQQWLGLAVLVVLAVIVWSALTGGDGEDEGDDLRHGAFDVCTQFVEDRLKAPGTAKFRNFFQDDGEVVVTGTGDGPYVVVSSVDSENSFGGELRTHFVCEVRHTGDEQWRLVDLSLG